MRTDMVAHQVHCNNCMKRFTQQKRFPVTITSQGTAPIVLATTVLKKTNQKNRITSQQFSLFESVFQDSVLYRLTYLQAYSYNRARAHRHTQTHTPNKNTHLHRLDTQRRLKQHNTQNGLIHCLPSSERSIEPQPKK